MRIAVYPIVVIAISFCLGILLGSFAFFNSALYFVIALTLLVLLFFLLNLSLPFTIVLIFASLFTGASSYSLWNEEINKQVEFLNNFQHSTVSVRGIVVSRPVVSYTPTGRTRFRYVLRVQQIENHTANCNIIVIAYGDKNTVCYGDEILIKGRLEKNTRRSDRIKFNAASIFKVRARNATHIINKDRGNKFVALTLRLKNRAESIIKDIIPDPVFGNLQSHTSSALVSALLLGDRINIPSSVELGFFRTGTIHILSVSGLHVGIIIFILLYFLYMARCPKKIIWIVLMVFLVAYSILTGLKPPVIRASIMGVIFLIGLSMERETSVWVSLCTALLIILYFSPSQLFNISFQLSFLSLAGVFIGAHIFKKVWRFDIKSVFQKITSYVTQSFFISSFACLATLPVISMYFGIITPVGLIANIIIIPLASLFLATSIAALFFSIFSNFLAGVLGETTSILALFMCKIAEFLSHIPFGYLMFDFPAWAIVIYYLIFFLVVFVGYVKMCKK
ncbi:hypothetical protein B9J78_01125 [bacterium Unc6]|nr:hypothetical protein [bacterium Unc6]